MDRVIDDTFAGLYSPRRMASIGRLDMAPDDRPGPYLLDIVKGLTRDGVFDYLSDGIPGVDVPLPGPSITHAPSHDLAAGQWFDDDPGYAN